jgi:tol-pal system protein YbgF
MRCFFSHYFWAVGAWWLGVLIGFPLATAASVDPDMLARMEARLQALEESINVLTGRFEEADHANRQLLRQLQDLRNSDAYRYGKLRIDGPDFEDKKAENTNIVLPEANHEVTTVRPGEEEVQQAYQQAFSLVKQSRLEEAETKLRDFIKSYADNPLVSNAYYWLGEILMVQKKTEDASIQYLKGYKAFPKGNRAQEHLVKLAASLQLLGESEKACKTLERLQKEFTDIKQVNRIRMDEIRSSVPCA